MKKFFTLLMLMVMATVNALAAIQETRVTDLSTISSDRYYKIKHSDRGTLVVADGKGNMLLQGATVSGSTSDCQAAVTFDKSLWRIVKVENYYTIQSCANNKYVGSTRYLSDEDIHLSIVSTGSNDEYYIKSGSNFLCFWPGYSWSKSGENDGPVAYKNTADGSNFQIYEVSDEDIEPTQTAINAAHSNNGKVGYPNTDALSTYFDGGVNIFNCSTAKTALNNVYTSNDVVLPEDGKAYTIKAVTVNADGSVDQSFQLYTDNNGVLKCAANGVAATTNTKFIAKAMDGNKTVLVNERGEYMIWTCDATSKALNTNGFTTEYDAQRNPLSIIHANRTMTGNNSNVTNLTDVQLFGKLEIGGLGTNTSESWYLIYDSSNGSGKFVAGTKGQKYYKNNNSNHTFLFLFEEVENPNKVVLTKPNSSFEGGLNQKYVGTFSAPYNVKLPEGVKAYTAEINDAKTIVTFNEIDGTVVPKNTGVLVYAEEGGEDINENAVPAATATLPSVGTDNIFEPMVSGSIGADNLVLGYTAGEGVMFYPLASAKTVNNKAYIPSSVGSVSSFRFDFEEPTTGISVAQTSTKTGVAFDLAGRRINANTKGICIMNGHKVIR